MKTELIKKLRLKKGCKYILIIPEASGITASEMARIDSNFVEMGLRVKTSRGIKIIEY